MDPVDAIVDRVLDAFVEQFADRMAEAVARRLANFCPCCGQMLLEATTVAGHPGADPVVPCPHCRADLVILRMYDQVHVFSRASLLASPELG